MWICEWQCVDMWVAVVGGGVWYVGQWCLGMGMWVWCECVGMWVYGGVWCGCGYGGGWVGVDMGIRGVGVAGVWVINFN